VDLQGRGRVASGGTWHQGMHGGVPAPTAHRRWVDAGRATLTPDACVGAHQQGIVVARFRQRCARSGARRSGSGGTIRCRAAAARCRSSSSSDCSCAFHAHCCRAQGAPSCPHCRSGRHPIRCTLPCSRLASSRHPGPWHARHCAASSSRHSRCRCPSLASCRRVACASTDRPGGASSTGRGARSGSCRGSRCQVCTLCACSFVQAHEIGQDGGAAALGVAVAVDVGLRAPGRVSTPLGCGRAHLPASKPPPFPYPALFDLLSGRSPANQGLAQPPSPAPPPTPPCARCTPSPLLGSSAPVAVAV